MSANNTDTKKDNQDVDMDNMDAQNKRRDHVVVIPTNDHQRTTRSNSGRHGKPPNSMSPSLASGQGGVPKPSQASMPHTPESMGRASIRDDGKGKCVTSCTRSQKYTKDDIHLPSVNSTLGNVSNGLNKQIRNKRKQTNTNKTH